MFFIGDDAGNWEEVAFEDALRIVMNAVSAGLDYAFTIDGLGNKIFIQCGHLAAMKPERRGQCDAARSTDSSTGR